MKTKQTECSETSAYKIQSPGNHQKERIQHSEHGERLISRKTFHFLHLTCVRCRKLISDYLVKRFVLSKISEATMQMV